MKTMIINIKQGFRLVFCVAVLASLTACEADTVESKGGKLPDPGPLENTYIKIRSVKSAHEKAVVSLTEGVVPATDRIYCQLTQPAERAMTITAAPDLTLVDAYNETNGTNLPAMPTANIEIANGGVFTVAAGERASDKIQITFKPDGLAPDTYLLPVAITSQDATFTEDNRVLYYGVRVRGLDMGDYELDHDFLNVFYVNTGKYQPLVADVWNFASYDMNSWSIEWERTYGNIVNLRITQITLDEATNRAIFTLTSDMRYVLEHADKYIRPLQDKGRKVCFSIEGAGSGLGFCNLTDTQIADFTGQVKAAVELYGLDGVNLFDRGSGYGAEGMPAMNTTSYPKLIKAMREAMPGKLLTVADYQAPTEYFWDTTATGGIAVGEYIDYAWSGYMSENEDIQLLDPWEVIDKNEAMMNGMTLTDYDRKPFAGLDPVDFGYFAVPWYPQNQIDMRIQGFLNLAFWRLFGWAPNNIIVWSDLILNEQSAYEGSWNQIPATIWMVFPQGAFTGEAMYEHVIDFEKMAPYNALKKDW